MEYENFMLEDIIGTIAALCLFPLILLVPGYVLGWLTNILSFKQRNFTTKIILGIALSVAACPIITYLLSRLFSFNSIWLVYSITWLLFIGIIANSFRRSETYTAIAHIKQNWLPILFVAVWAIIATLSLVDLQLGGKLYINLVSYDYTKNVAVTAAITRTGIPPVNPSFFPERSLELYYYYFWFLICSLVDSLGGAFIPPRAAVIAGTIWAGISLICILLLYLRFLEPNGKDRIKTRATAGICLLIVTGLDIIPVLAETLSKITIGKGRLYPDIEWWNPQSQVTAWLGAMLWVPHHVSGLVACLTGIFLLRSIQNTPRLRDRVFSVLIAGCAFASALGLSIWVTFVAVTILAVWMLISLYNKWRIEALSLALIGLEALMLSVPYLLDLRSSNNNPGVSPIALTIRSFGPVKNILTKLGMGDGWPVGLTNLLFLPLNYFMELGFFAIAGWLYWKERSRSGDKPNREDIFKIAMLSTSVLVCTFLRANLQDNDLGWRGFMYAQFVLLIWSANLAIPLLRGIFKNSKKVEELRGNSPNGSRIGTFLTLLLIIGTLSTGYNLTMLRFYPAIVDMRQLELQSGKRTHAIRQAYQWINQNRAEKAITQHNPNVWVDHFHGLYANRQVVAADDNYGKLYGISPSFYKPISLSISEIFSTRVELNKVDEICKKFSIDSLVVKDTDKVWSDRQSWVWRLKPMFSNDFSKVFICSQLAEEIKAISTE